VFLLAAGWLIVKRVHWVKRGEEEDTGGTGDTPVTESEALVEAEIPTSEEQ
jgi:hypothetical protein